MAPALTRKRKSEESPGFATDRTLVKKRKVDLTVAQKQALIDNLQLEITERARRLRAQYNIQAQQLRSRVEMRVNRIPTAMRKLKMGDLMAKHSEPQKTRTRSPYVAKPPPVPLKDGASPKPIPRKPVSGSTQRGQKRLSETITGSEDKENSVEPTVMPKKKGRGAPAAAAAEASRNVPGQVLSPASTNARVLPRAAERPASPAKSMLYSSSSPAKSMIARPASPSKAMGTKSSSNLITNMVQKAKSTRGATAGTRKATTSSSTTGTASRSKKPAVPSASATGSTRGRRKISQTSESSEASTGTVVKKTTAASRGGTTTAKNPPAVKRSVMNTIKSATTKKAAPVTKSTTGTSTAGRTLRKRQAA
ncbi:hypothetical protein PFICI_00581 [Pestalotiopsis fici W106-1]|uniref:Borealin N-terminal domain-containing protein n=1 Tax=Pestalotiopsis fici (strain W106-1 / CGMCC3.15140) TaxID=1229662 RepID=W3XL34_PESFW|nr:uncharacterized protein PFICI_00581 [Pestalotiopsis fici W106-1]ETS86753.1 hypothetical protein PFICI_00581 [Pestalotiopsis fici W106-1]